jgi:AcrR family transcriptional regulator
MYPTKRKASARTRERIVGAVRELLAEGAFHESTVEEVATRAGVARATLYTHFRSRLDLVDALCDTFAETSELAAAKESRTVAEVIARSVDFWAAEEQTLAPLYGAAAVDPAAGELVERQRRDRQNELRRILRLEGRADRETFALISLLTSFETYLELRRHARLPKRRVVETLQEAAARYLRAPSG